MVEALRVIVVDQRFAELADRSGTVEKPATGLRDFYWVHVDDHRGPAVLLHRRQLVTLDGEELPPQAVTRRELGAMIGAALTVALLAVAFIAAAM